MVEICMRGSKLSGMVKVGGTKMNTITSLARSNIKRDRTRSILVGFSIIMTTMLLTAIASVGYGIIQMNRGNAGEWYGSYYGYMRSVSEEQITEMSRHSEFTEIGKAAFFGTVDMDRDSYLVWADEEAAEMNNAERDVAEGRYPQAENEIAAQYAFFRELGIENPKIGDTVSVHWRRNLNEPFVEDTFVICGLLKDPENGYSQLNANVSMEFFEKKISVEERRYNAYFRLAEDLPIDSGNAKEVMTELAQKCGIGEDAVRENEFYLNWKLNPGTETIITCIVIAAIVVLFSVVVIYNIFQVGIMQKVQEYGKLKAIGATRRQMKRVLFYEGMSIAAVGVPVGLLLGLLAAKAVMLYLLSAGMTINTDGISVLCPPLVLLAAVVAFLTVWIALKKPMRVVASVSPVEAMRYQEAGVKGKGIRRGRKELGVYGMTFANLSAHKRRTVSTIVSMGLSCVLFLVIASCIRSMDIEYEVRKFVEYGQFVVSLDYSKADMAYPENNLDSVLSNNPINEELKNEILSISGVTAIDEEYLLYARVQGADGAETGELYSVRVVNREEFERLKGYYEDSNLGELDYDAASAENQILYGHSYSLQNYGVFEIGDALQLSLGDGAQTAELQTTLAGSFGMANAEFVITEDTYRSLGFSGEPVGTLWVYCGEADVMAVEGELRQLLAGRNHVEMDSYRANMESYESALHLMRTGGYLFCFLIGVISFFNMANTIITSMVTRKQEFGILQAIGLTNRQLNMSLQLEGIIFTLGTVFVAVIAGLPLGYAVFCFAKSEGIMGMNVYHFPIWEMIGMLVLLALMQGILSCFLSRNVKKESLVERIRHQG